MSLSLSSSMICKPLFPNPQSSSSTSKLLQPTNRTRFRTKGSVSKCEANEQSSSSPSSTPSSSSSSSSSSQLSIGSPIIITEAPQMIKTAASVPCLRVNGGLINPGDVGRIISRKPMDVWAVRLGIGTYLIDRKYFKPLELDE